MAGEINTTTVLNNLLPDLHSDSYAHLTFWTQAQLIQFADEAAKQLSRACMFNVERDTSITTVNGTATYPLPSRHDATLNISFGSSSLRPATVVELEARSPSFQTDSGTPDHWYEDDLSLNTVGLSPLPIAAVSLPVIASMYPPDLDVGQANVLLQAPAPVAGYLTFAVLAAAYGGEGESEQPDLAQHCKARCDLYEQILRKYYGHGI